MTKSTAQTALVTGASRGIGLAICRRLLEQDYAVIGVARDFSSTPLKHPHFHCHSIDLADLAQLPARFRKLLKQYPGIDTLICCAGQGQFGSLEEFSYQQMQALMDINFSSAAYLTRAILPEMKTNRQGTIIFIGSEAALGGARQGAMYCASKFALRGFAQALREECSRRGIRVSIINPGMAATDFFSDLHFEPGSDDVQHITAEDIAEAVSLIINARPGTVVDEINLSPLKKVIKFKEPS